MHDDLEDTTEVFLKIRIFDVLPLRMELFLVGLFHHHISPDNVNAEKVGDWRSTTITRVKCWYAWPAMRLHVLERPRSAFTQT
jgi:hypothetical protein